MQNKKLIVVNILSLLLSYNTYVYAAQIPAETSMQQMIKDIENNYIPAADIPNVPDALPLTQLIKGILNNMVYVKGGNYAMGDAGFYKKNVKGEKKFYYWAFGLDNKPAHKVILTSYSINKYLTTFAEYDTYTKITHQTPTLAIFLLSNPIKTWRTGNYPAQGMSWYAAKAYCNWLGKITGLPFNLPTEAQWEYAARSRGKTIQYATNNGLLIPNKNIAYKQHSYAVGAFPPNPLGLYDMSGSISEWVNDWYSKVYYQNSPENNPLGPATGKDKVIRTDQILVNSNVYARNKLNPKLKVIYVGFRCVLNSDKPVAELKTAAMENLKK